MRTVIAMMYLLQPASRLGGRLRFGLAPWRRRANRHLALPRPRTSSVWSERWQSPDTRLRRIESELQEGKCVVERGGDFERWDLQVRGGGLGAARMRMAVEEHGGGKQLLRFRIWPRCSRAGLGLAALFTALTVAAALDGTLIGALVLGTAAAVLIGATARDTSAAMGVIVPAVEHHSDEPRPALDAEPSSNGAAPAPVKSATRLVPRPFSNGNHADGAPEPAPRNGAIGVPTPIHVRRHGLNVSDHEE